MVFMTKLVSIEATHFSRAIFSLMKRSYWSRPPVTTFST
jgi:hypothetical protein